MLQYFKVANRLEARLGPINPFSAGTAVYAYANRLDPGQPPSNSVAGLRSNLFATQSIILHKKNKQNLKVLKSRQQYYLFLENYPAFKGLNNAHGLQIFLMYSIS